jgi:hypothetical protein
MCEMVPMPSKVLERAPNWLPIPGVISAEEKHSARVDENDFFRKGEIVSFQPRQRHGEVANDRGLRIPFDLHEASIVGDPTNIGVGMRIGYDASRISGGLRVTVLKIY